MQFPHFHSSIWSVWISFIVHLHNSSDIYNLSYGWDAFANRNFIEWICRCECYLNLVQFTAVQTFLILLEMVCFKNIFSIHSGVRIEEEGGGEGSLSWKFCSEWPKFKVHSANNWIWKYRNGSKLAMIKFLFQKYNGHPHVNEANFFTEKPNKKHSWIDSIKNNQQSTGFQY